MNSAVSLKRTAKADKKEVHKLMKMLNDGQVEESFEYLTKLISIILGHAYLAVTTWLMPCPLKIK